MTKRVTDCLKMAFIVAIIPWAVWALDLILPWDLRMLGIHPRELSGLWGILFSPFLHAGIWHLAANTGALFTLTFLCLLFEARHFFSALGVIIIAGGGLVWIFGGSGTVHIGASGVVFGLFGFLLAMGYFERNLKAILASILVFVLYGGLLFSLLRVQAGISWSSHFFGLGAGVLAAWGLAEKKPKKPGKAT